MKGDVCTGPLVYTGEQAEEFKVTYKCKTCGARLSFPDAFARDTWPCVWPDVVPHTVPEVDYAR